MTNIRLYSLFALLLIIAFSVGRFSAPKSIETKTSEHIENNQKENINKNENVVDVVKETRLPDGTVITEKRKEKETSTQTQVQTSTETQKDSSTKIEVRPSYRIGVGYEPAIKGFQETTYSVDIEKRLFSELYFGVMASSRRTVGISLSLGF